MKFKGVKIKPKKAIWFILLFIFFLFIFLYYTQSYHGPKTFGVSFSHTYAQELGLNDKEVYSNILEEFEIHDLKLSTYFKEIQPQENTYDFELLDWQVQEAINHDVNLILAIGLRTPRWPECHAPDWWHQLEKTQQDEALLEYIKTIVLRYDRNENIVAWQIENEPELFFFGECPPFDMELFEKEIELVRSISDKPILSTASGELENWNSIQEYVDIIGTSMYRIVYNDTFGYIPYKLFFPPAYYEGKRRLVNKPVYVTEYQAEPWTNNKHITELTLEEEQRSMTHQHFKYLFKFAQKHKFDKFYLWGVEWWYYKKVMHNDPFYWEYAKKQIHL